jgi:dihydroflavonol-4-reductase
VLGPDYSSSIELVQRLLTGAMPVVPCLFFGVVDVRDVAALHLLAMTNPAAAGQRFLAVAGEQYGLPSIAQLLRDQLGPEVDRVPTSVIPDRAVRLGARFNPSLRHAAPQVSKRKMISNDRARHILGWIPRTNKQAVLATAPSLLDLGQAAGS